MRDYPVKKLNGFKIRSAASGSNCQPFSGWESSDLVLLDFGQENMRKNFFDLVVVEEISNITDFFEQYGRWCAFDYIVGTKDRHLRNYVFDKSDGSVYSVDNEERPYDASLNFAPFDSELRNFNANVQKFLPPVPESKRAAIVEFGRGFLNCWTEIARRFAAIDWTADPELNQLEAKTDIGYVRAVLSQRHATLVLEGISLQ
jgi:hypothetical protein